MIIGGLLLMSLITLKNNFIASSHESTFAIISHSETDNLRQMITRDLRHIGFGQDSKVLNFSDDHIRFRARIEGSNRVISWRIMPGNNASYANPNLKQLRRQGPLGESPQSQTHNFPVKTFQVTAYSDMNGLIETEDKDEVRSVRVDLVLESEHPTGTRHDGSPKHSRSAWSKLIRPQNMMYQ